MTYINELTNPKKAAVTKLLPRPKGLIIATEQYDCFLYKDNKLCKKLMELYSYFRSNPEEQCTLYVVPDKKVKVGFKIELGDAFKWFMYESKLQTFPDEEDDVTDFISELKNKILAPSQDSSPEQSKSTERKNGSTKQRKTL